MDVTVQGINSDGSCWCVLDSYYEKDLKGTRYTRSTDIEHTSYYITLPEFYGRFPNAKADAIYAAANPLPTETSPNIHAGKIKRWLDEIKAMGYTTGVDLMHLRTISGIEGLITLNFFDASDSLIILAKEKGQSIPFNVK